MKKVISFCLIVISVFPGVFAQTSEKQQEKKELKPALLVIDMQQAFLPFMSKSDQEGATAVMNWAIQVFRKDNLPVIRVYHQNEEWGVKPGEQSFEFSTAVQVTESDLKVVKTYASAFTKTDLDKILKEKGVNSLFLCGLSSTGCVLATFFDAASYDYKAFMIKDAMLGPKESYTDSVEDMFSALDLEAVMYMLEVTR